VFNITFNNISVLLVEETGITGENHRTATSHRGCQLYWWRKPG